MSQLTITLADIERLRARRWRTQPSRRISGERGALRLIEELGFVLLVSIGDEEMPSIHAAAGGDWGVWWDWKQTLPERKACYYAKVIRRRGTFISWEWLPRFYAAYADPRPYWRLYRDGLLDRTEKQVLDLLEQLPPLLVGAQQRLQRRRVLPPAKKRLANQIGIVADEMDVEHEIPRDENLSRL